MEKLNLQDPDSIIDHYFPELQSQNSNKKNPKLNKSIVTNASSEYEFKDFSTMNIDEIDQELQVIETLYDEKSQASQYVPDFVEKFQEIFLNLKSTHENCVRYWKLIKESAQEMSKDVYDIKNKEDEIKIDTEVLKALKAELVEANHQLKTQIEREQESQKTVQDLEYEIKKLKEFYRRSEQNNIKKYYFE